MADATEQAAQGTPVQTQAAPVAQQATPAPTAVQQESEPAWLPARLARAQETAQKELLAKLGIDDPEKAKAFIKAGQDAENERKTLAEKLADQAKADESNRAKIERLSGVVSLQAAAQMSSLTAEQQAAVKAIAGEDPAEQLRAVIALAPTWASAAAVASAAAAAAQAAATPAPASTSPAPAAPPGVSPGSPPDHKAVHQQLLTTNPVAAARYAATHPSVFSD